MSQNEFQIQFSFTDEKYNIDIESINKNLTLQQFSYIQSALIAIKTFVYTNNSKYDSMEELLEQARKTVNKCDFKCSIKKLQLNIGNISLIDFEGVVKC